jgi:uncharacterized protein DUF4396
MGHTHAHASGQAADGSRSSLNRVAFAATWHCLTGCAIGEVLGLVLAAAFGWGDVTSIAVAVVLAFFFGYSLTLGPVVKGGVSLRDALRVAFAADTVSIAVMEKTTASLIYCTRSVARRGKRRDETAAARPGRRDELAGEEFGVADTDPVRLNGAAERIAMPAYCD